jgi:hypothetical protein
MDIDGYLMGLGKLRRSQQVFEVTETTGTEPLL